eukprot:TRINITY_DN694_c0_g1_i13.p2 TRINITY_DN694_c0_g1~~TRINITY_DN694_c0_g1_i13.p2  ORF type:complete len:100 (-),score=15.41 TRINITY_DN694_c0_g1_i13:5-304(-)
MTRNSLFILPHNKSTVTVFFIFHQLLPSIRTNASHCTPTLRSEERFSRNAETDLVCRLLLEKKKPKKVPASPIPFSNAFFGLVVELSIFFFDGYCLGAV